MTRSGLSVLIACLAAIVPTAVVADERPTSLADCDVRVQRDPDQPASYRCFHTVARVHDNWDAAVARLEALLALDGDNHLARLALAGIEANRGVDRAERLYRDALSGLAEGDRPDLEIEARLDFSMFLALRGRIDDAQAEIDRAAETADRLDSPVQRAWVSTHEGLQAYRRDEYGRAERLLRAAEDVIFVDGSAHQQSGWLSAMGATHWAMARYQDSLEDYGRQAALLRETGDRYQEASARSNIALLTSFTTPMPWSDDQRGRVEALVRDSLEVAREGGNWTIVAKSHLYLAQLTRDVEHKRKHLDDSLVVYRRTHHMEDRLFATRLLAESLIKEEPTDPERGFRLADEAERIARDHGYLQGVMRARTIRAVAEWDRGRRSDWAVGSRERAIVASLAALDSVEALRDRQSDAVVRARSFAPWAWLYYNVIGNLLWPPAAKPSREDTDLAFRVGERMRARAFLDQLDAAHAAVPATVDEEEAAHRTRVLEEIAALNRGLMNPTLPDPQRQETLAALEKLEVEEAALRSEQARADPVTAVLRSPDPRTPDDVRAALAEDQALLSFVIAKADESLAEFLGGSWLLVLTRDGTDVYRLPNRGEMESTVGLFLGMVRRRDGSEVAGAVRLYRDLLEEAFADLPPEVNRLVVIPDGPLHHLPFGALRPDTSGEPIGIRYEITLAPSAATWLLWRRAERRPTERPALALVDPDLPTSMVDPATEAGTVRSWELSRETRLGALPRAREEGAAVARHLGGGSRVLAGENATERHVKDAALDRFAVVHFAAHALVDDEHPERSGVLLAAGGEDQDGLLQVREVVDLDLAGGVVVLSGCRSASGEVLEGEGALSLARGFFVAGSHAVVGSLWPLRDDDAAALFEDFYRHLGAGKSLGDALTSARRDRVSAGAPAAAWAGVVLFGDGDLVPLPGGRRGWLWSWWQLAFVASLLAVAAAERGVVAHRRRGTA